MAWLEDQLEAAGSNSVCKSIESLLSFLNLPGTVLAWLPIEKVTLQHIAVQKLFLKAAAMMAVDSMMNFNLAMLTNGFQQQAALFLITATGDRHKPLEVFAVNVQLRSNDLSNIAAQPPASTCISKASSTLDTMLYMLYMDSTEVIPLPANGAAAGCTLTNKWGSFVLYTSRCSSGA
jgi:hypothetical protein